MKMSDPRINIELSVSDLERLADLLWADIRDKDYSNSVTDIRNEDESLLHYLESHLQDVQYANHPDEWDGQPSEWTEWHDFDENC
jgi:hypothetical protein